MYPAAMHALHACCTSATYSHAFYADVLRLCVVCFHLLLLLLQQTFWPYTDFFKWTLVTAPDGRKGITLQCFTDSKFKHKQEVNNRTTALSLTVF
jgi:hypothetical protein